MIEAGDKSEAGEGLVWILTQPQGEFRITSRAVVIDELMKALDLLEPDQEPVMNMLKVQVYAGATAKE